MISTSFESERVSPEGSWPSEADWLRQCAVPRDAIFADDQEVVAAFSEKFQALNDIMELSSVERDQLIERLMNLAIKRPDIVRMVEFNRVPMKQADGSYMHKRDLERALQRDVSFNTFEATVHLSSDKKYPKSTLQGMRINDFCVPGLALPHSLNAYYDFGAKPWIIGSDPKNTVGFSVAIPGEDNQTTHPVYAHGLSYFADAEALGQSLDVITELTQELFGAIEN